MKLKVHRLRELVKRKLDEAAAEGKFQGYAKGTYASMINLLRQGKNNNTPPFSKKAAGPGKSGPDDSDYAGE
jgi:hypothetical protein